MKRRDKEYFQKLNIEQGVQWHREIIDRIMQVYGFKEKKSLAEHIGCHQNMPSNWIQTCNIPWQVVHLCHKETGATLDWLYYGLCPPLVFSPEQKDEITKLTQQLQRLVLA